MHASAAAVYSSRDGAKLHSATGAMRPQTSSTAADVIAALPCVCRCFVEHVVLSIHSTAVAYMAQIVASSHGTAVAYGRSFDRALTQLN
jgi:hypothetical protein